MGSEVRAKEESQKVFLLGDCSISRNKDRKDAVQIKGCPPPIVDSITAIALKSFPRQKAVGILMSRTIKKLGTKLGTYHEAFPIFGICELPEFDKEHF